MRAVVQRVTESSVSVNNEIIGKIGGGLMVLLGVAAADKTDDADYLADKITHLRIFEDENGKMNRSLIDTGGEMLVGKTGRKGSGAHLIPGQDQSSPRRIGSICVHCCCWGHKCMDFQ